MSYKPGDTFYTVFTTQRYGTGVVTAADSLPTCKIVRNGAVDTTGITLTVTSLETGVYSVSCTLNPVTGGPWVTGDAIQIFALATVNNIAGKSKIADLILDGYRLSDSPPSTPTLSTKDSAFIHSGTAQAGAALAITLTSGASAVDGFYVGCAIKLYGGTGAGQPENVITAYNGSTKVATVQRTWTTNPDSTSIYGVSFQRRPVIDANLAVTAGTVTPTVNANVIQVNSTTATTTTPAPTVAQVAAGILVNPANLLLTDSAGEVNLNLAQTIPTTGNTAHTMGDSLNAARAQGFGTWKRVGNVISLYANDGTTVVRTLTLDSSSNPTQRIGS